MELAMICAKQIVGILLIMLAGVICAKTKILDREVNKRLSDLLLNIVSPAVFLLAYQREYDPSDARNLLIAFALSLLALLISCGVAYPLFRKRADDRRYCSERFGAIYGNAGFFGIPLVNGVFGAEGVFYLTAFITAFNLMVWTHGVICMSGRFDLRSLKKGLLTPSMISICLGIVLFFGRVRLPELIATPLEYISSLNTGLAMLVAGVSLANTDLKALLSGKRVFLVCLARLLLCPALFGLALMALPVEPLLRGTLLLASACPCATMVILFAYRYGGDDIYGTQIFTASTLLCALSIPLVMLMA
ncbi:MAG: AEC family transporter [Eubacteriales bacterium]|nr:AEC family transporter [Eubacteriales bacterium]